jgi:alkylation response protein AidB-like acyl-CoA dehydrogenase
LRAARALVFDEIGSLWATAVNGDVPSITGQANIRLAALEVMHAALLAVDTALELSGASAIRSDHVLQRCFRDAHTVEQHAYFGSAALQRCSRVRLGMEESSVML